MYQAEGLVPLTLTLTLTLSLYQAVTCIFLNSQKAMFYPRVDEYAVLEVPGKPTRPLRGCIGDICGHDRTASGPAPHCILYHGRD
jgi:hypothetical protein